MFGLHSNLFSGVLFTAVAGQGCPIFKGSYQAKYIGNTVHQKYKVFGGRRSFLWPQDLDVLNNIIKWREGRRMLSEELMAKLKWVGILRKPPKNIRKVQISDSAYYIGQSLTNSNLDVVFLANGKKKKNILYRL